MRQCSGGGARDRVRETSGAAFGNNYAMSAGGKGSADDGAEIVRIFDAIEENNQTQVIFGFICVIDDVFEGGGCAHGGDRDDALVLAGVGEAIELAAIFKTNGDAARASELHDFFDASVLAALGDDDAVEGAAGFEGFADGVNASEAVHGGSLSLNGGQLEVGPPVQSSESKIKIAVRIVVEGRSRTQERVSELNPRAQVQPRHLGHPRDEERFFGSLDSIDRADMGRSSATPLRVFGSANGEFGQYILSQSRAEQNWTMRVRVDLTGVAKGRVAASSRRRMTRSSSPSPGRPARARRKG